MCAVLLFASCGATKSIQQSVSDSEEIPFQKAEVKPSFQGGDENKFVAWMNERLTFPSVARENGVRGGVTARFVIDESGKVSDVKILKGVETSLDKEVVRVLSMSPQWTPASLLGVSVPMEYVVVVSFHPSVSKPSAKLQ